MQKVNIIRQSNLFSGLMALGIQYLPRSCMTHKRELILTLPDEADDEDVSDEEGSGAPRRFPFDNKIKKIKSRLM